jgi:rhodanese-related sulfurtransferase
VALLLRRQGITRIRPLQGGLNAWRNLGYAMQNHEAAEASLAAAEAAK